MAALQYNLFAQETGTPAIPTPDEPYTDPFRAAIADTLDRAGDAPLEFDENEWDSCPDKQVAVGLDVEVYHNFFVACFMRFRDGKRLAFERSDRSDFDGKGRLASILRSNFIVTFNGSTYDLVILAMAVAGKSCREMKEASDLIIASRMRPWEVAKKYDVELIRGITHVDLFEVNPSVRMGLKTLAGRLHARYVVDLPYEPDAILTPRQMNLTTLYCFNDLDATGLLYAICREPLRMRLALGKRYGLDLLSRSDAQVGEVIIKKRVEELTKRPIRSPKDLVGMTFSYEIPSFVSFESEHLFKIID